MISVSVSARPTPRPIASPRYLGVRGRRRDLATRPPGSYAARAPEDELAEDGPEEDHGRQARRRPVRHVLPRPLEHEERQRDRVVVVLRRKVGAADDPRCERAAREPQPKSRGGGRRGAQISEQQDVFGVGKHRMIANRFMPETVVSTLRPPWDGQQRHPRQQLVFSSSKSESSNSSAEPDGRRAMARPDAAGVAHPLRGGSQMGDGGLSHGTEPVLNGIVDPGRQH